MFTVHLFFNELHDLYSDVQLNVTAKLLCMCAGGDLDDEISFFTMAATFIREARKESAKQQRGRWGVCSLPRDIEKYCASFFCRFK